MKRERMEEGEVKKKGEKERDKTTDSRCGSHRGFLSNNIQKCVHACVYGFPKLMPATKASRVPPINPVHSRTKLHAPPPIPINRKRKCMLF